MSFNELPIGTGQRTGVLMLNQELVKKRQRLV